MAMQLSVDPILRAFIDDEALPGTGVTPERFWSGLEAIVADMAPRNAALLARRDALQAQIDAFYSERRGQTASTAIAIEIACEGSDTIALVAGSERGIMPWSKNLEIATSVVDQPRAPTPIESNHSVPTAV